MSWQYDNANGTLDKQEARNRLARIREGSLSRRTYNFLIGLIVAVSFLFIGLEYTYLLNNPWVIESLNPVFNIACGTAPFVGIIIMALANRERIGLMIVGYIMTTFTLGFLMAIALTDYDAASIQRAMLITAVIAISFATLGFVWPQLFNRIFQICVLALGIMVVVELVMLLLDIQAGWNDWVIIVIFCGLIGHDFHYAATDTPTIANAIWHACDIYLDLGNVFLRVLNITGRSRD